MSTLGALCHIRDNGRLLLQQRVDGALGARLWNSPGGHVEANESPLEGAIREVREETGLAVRDLLEHGQLTFYFGNESEPAYIVHVFSTEHFEGEVRASDEGPLEWFSEDELPYDRMFPDDRHWLPHLLAGRRFRGVFRITADLASVISHELDVDA